VKNRAGLLKLLWSRYKRDVKALF